MNNKDFACGDGVRFILSALKENGEKAYTVGGCVRDTLLGREPNDWDICTSALPERTAGIFRSLGCGVIETGLKHGTVTVRYHGENYEVTTFRKDCTYSDNRHPDAVEFVSDIKEDLSRRDFTINAMAYAPGEDVIDPFGGQTDLRFGIIRCVGDQRERFSEDALRILRAMRFASRYGFVIEPETKDAMLALRGLLNNIAYVDHFCEVTRTMYPEVPGYAQGYVNIDAVVLKVLRDGSARLDFKCFYDIRQYDKNMDGCYVTIEKID